RSPARWRSTWGRAASGSTPSPRVWSTPTCGRATRPSPRRSPPRPRSRRWDGGRARRTWPTSSRGSRATPLASSPRRRSRPTAAWRTRPICTAGTSSRWARAAPRRALLARCRRDGAPEASRARRAPSSSSSHVTTVRRLAPAAPAGAAVGPAGYCRRMEPGTRVDPTEAQPHEHGALCHIVPPYLLQRLEQHPDPAVQACARATLAADAALREAGRQPPSVAASPRTSVTVRAPAPDRTISDARHERQLPGERVRAEGDPAVAAEAVNQAYDGLGHTWALLLEEFGRYSLDGAGMPLHATVHYGRDYANAFWDGERMVFGDGDGEVFTGFTGAVDVIGHELAHGVTELTVGLVYRGQPGALNESVSDVLGSLVKQRLAGQTAEEADWLIGAGLFTSAVQGEALRSLRAPGTAY